MNELTDAFNRYYLSLSVAELKFSDLFGDLGRLPYNTVLYLDYITYHPGCTATEIAEAIGVTKATVSTTVIRLEKKGLLVRERSEADRRVYNIRISDKMSKAYDICFGITSRMAERICGAYTDEEVDLFCRMLNDASGFMESSVQEK